MKVEKEISDDNHLLRWVPKRATVRDPRTNIVIGIAPTAFEFKEKEIPIGKISSSWLQFYGNELEECRNAAINDLKNSMVSDGRCTLKPTGAFTVGNVGAIREAFLQKEFQCVVEHARTKLNPSHATVTAPFDELEILQVMAISAWADWVPASDYIS